MNERESKSSKVSLEQIGKAFLLLLLIVSAVVCYLIMTGHLEGNHYTGELGV